MLDLSSALTLEHLEAAFYREGFNQFPDSQFEALGLSEASIDALKKVGQTEAEHVSFLMSALAGAGQKPVQPCHYNFEFTDATSMINTASILEAVGVSAYVYQIIGCYWASTLIMTDTLALLLLSRIKGF